jgi:hypothetical protein
MLKVGHDWMTLFATIYGVPSVVMTTVVIAFSAPFRFFNVVIIHSFVSFFLKHSSPLSLVIMIKHKRGEEFNKYCFFITDHTAHHAKSHVTVTRETPVHKYKFTPKVTRDSHTHDDELSYPTTGTVALDAGTDFKISSIDPDINALSPRGGGIVTDSFPRGALAAFRASRIKILAV